MARPMVKEAGMASLLLENPYYILGLLYCITLPRFVAFEWQVQIVTELKHLKYSEMYPRVNSSHWTGNAKFLIMCVCVEHIYFNAFQLLTHSNNLCSCALTQFVHGYRKPKDQL